MQQPSVKLEYVLYFVQHAITTKRGPDQDKIQATPIIVHGMTQEGERELALDTKAEKSKANLKSSHSPVQWNKGEYANAVLPEGEEL